MKHSMKHMKGAGLLDILLAVVIFVVGMLALAHLQTNMTRSATDANTRTIATNIGEEILETLRSFQRVSTDPSGTIFAYEDIDKTYVDKSSITRSGNTFSVTATVDDYYFSADRTSVTKTKPAGAVMSDFKYVELTVSWNNDQDFQIDENTQITRNNMGSGSITIKEVIPSIPSLANAKVAAEDDGALSGPPVDYTPGAKPAIVAISLDNNSKFKESTTPKPDVIVADEKVETWFDVVTYNQSTNTVFLRREEFLVLSCDCTLRIPSGGEKTGFLPTTWNGVQYVEGEWVSKTYGEASSKKDQSGFCNTCCRDHHDSSAYPGNDFVYDPVKTWTEAGGPGGDHKHYGEKNGSLVEATKDGDEYFEACRMIRTDGFMRVAQDFRQEGLIATQQSFFNDSTNISNYSSYVTGAVEDFYDKGGPLSEPADGALPGDSTTNAVALPLPDGTTFDQQVSRAIYIDHLTTEAAELVKCMAPKNMGGDGKTGDECGAAGASNYLEVYPFYEVQTTWLSWWSENANAKPVSVSNDPLADDNGHSRGLTRVTSADVAQVIVNDEIHRGNVGLTATDPIDPLYYTKGITDVNMYVDANNTGPEPPPPPTGGGLIFSGTITSYDSKLASRSSITGVSGLTCTKDAATFSCVNDGTAVAPITITISNYSAKVKGEPQELWVCESSGLWPTSWTTLPNTATIDISAAASNVTNIVLIIQTSPCS